MQVNKKVVVTLLITGLIYYFYFNSFIENYISAQIDIKMILTLVLSYYIYLVVSFVVDRRFQEKDKYAFKFIYVIMLITLFFSKSINSSTYVETFNLDVSNVKYSITSNVGYLILIMNVVLIVPLGFMYRRFDFIVKLILPLLVFLFVEYIQYSNNIGVFDINDIILNTIGFYIGGFIIAKIIK